MGLLVIDTTELTMEDAQLDTVQDELSRAVREGGAWLTFGGRAGWTVVWVSPSSAIRLEYEQRPQFVAHGRPFTLRSS